MPKEWTNKHIEKLIKLYRERPCLWRITHEHYTNKHVKNRAYEEIVEQFLDDIPTVDQTIIKAKIQNLRSTYRKELRKVKACKRSEKWEDQLYEPTLWYYELLHFTKDQKRRPPGDSNLHSPQRSADDSECSVERKEEMFNVDEPIPDSRNEGSGERRQTEQQEEIFEEPQTKKKRTEETEADVATFMKTYAAAALGSQPTNTDDCVALGNYVSAKLRKMDETQQILAEALIQKVITRGMRKQLTDNTDLYESPVPHV